ALDRFFTLMAKVEKDKEAMKRRLNMRGKRPEPAGDILRPPKGHNVKYPGGGQQPEYAPEAPAPKWTGGRPAKKAIPKKIKRLLNLDNQDPSGLQSTGPGDSYEPIPPRVTTTSGRPPQPGKKTKPRIASKPRPMYGGRKYGGMRKRIIERVDPEIGPSHSVGHKKPSDLSPESGVSKLAKRMIRDLVGEPNAQMRKQAGEGMWGTPGPYTGGRGNEGLSPAPTIRHPKPSKTPKKPVKKNVVALTAPGGVGNQPGSGRVKPGTPPKTYNSPQGFSGRRMGGPGSKSPDANTSGAGVKMPRVRKGTNLGQKTSQRRAPYVGSRPGGKNPLLQRRRKIDDITGGRVGAGGKITPVKPSKGGPGQPTGYGSTGNPQYNYGRKAAKGCGCETAAAVAKAVRAVRQ
ncbi:hypothetical protein LCGC14_2073380, partial [marine sediment metagenome]